MNDETLAKVKEAYRLVTEEGIHVHQACKDVKIGTATFYTGRKALGLPNLPKGGARKPYKKRSKLQTFIDIPPPKPKALDKVAVIVCEPDQIASIIGNLRGDR